MKNQINIKDTKTRLRIILTIIFSICLIILGLPIHFVLFCCFLIIFLFLLKGQLYKRVDKFLNKKFPSISKLSPTTKKIIFTLAFIIAYMILKQIIFLILRTLGIDVKRIIINTLI